MRWPAARQVRVPSRWFYRATGDRLSWTDTGPSRPFRCRDKRTSHTIGGAPAVADLRADAGRSWTIANRCQRPRGAGQSEPMFPSPEFSDVRRRRDGERVQRIFVHTDRNLPVTSRRVPDVVSPSDNTRAAGRSLA